MEKHGGNLAQGERQLKASMHTAHPFARCHKRAGHVFQGSFPPRQNEPVSLNDNRASDHELERL